MVVILSGLGLEATRALWDDPIMTVKTDDRKRVVLPTAKPGDVFEVQVTAGGNIMLTKLVPRQSRLVRARKVNGLVMGAADVEIDPESIVEAIRADRESR